MFIKPTQTQIQTISAYQTAASDEGKYQLTPGKDSAIGAVKADEVFKSYIPSSPAKGNSIPYRKRAYAENFSGESNVELPAPSLQLQEESTSEPPKDVGVKKAKVKAKPPRAARQQNVITKDRKQLDDGTILEGEFKNGEFYRGTRIDRDGTTYTGSFKNDMLQGTGGTKILPDGTTLKGKFSKGELISGSLTNKDKTIIYSGTFKNNKLHGTGTIEYRAPHPVRKVCGTFEHGNLVGV